MAVIVGIGLALADLHLAQVAGAGEHEQSQVRQGSRARRGIERQPALDTVGDLVAGRAAPFAVGRGNRVQKVAIEAVVSAMLREIIFDRAFGQAHHCAQLGLDLVRSAQPGQRIAGPRALHQISDRVLLAEPQAEALDVGDQRFIAAAFGLRQQIGERRARQFLLGAPLDRLETRRDPRLGRKRREQRLGEAVDGLDAQAAGRVEHLGEQPARALHGRRVVGLAEIDTGRCARSWSRIRTQLASRVLMRLAISAAPALVKVRHSRCSGRTPASSRRSTRAVSTCVLPVPADADSAAWTSGSDASAWSPLSSGKGLEPRAHQLAPSQARAEAIESAP